jgi:hypothetical protein
MSPTRNAALAAAPSYHFSASVAAESSLEVSRLRRENEHLKKTSRQEMAVATRNNQALERELRLMAAELEAMSSENARLSAENMRSSGGGGGYRGGYSGYSGGGSFGGGGRY